MIKQTFGFALVGAVVAVGALVLGGCATERGDESVLNEWDGQDQTRPAAADRPYRPRIGGRGVHH